MSQPNCKVTVVSQEVYDKLAEVDLIASGYEFDCPSCREYNATHAVPRHGRALQCWNCKSSFRLGGFSDAID
jgi:hypothetical protein